MQRTIRSRLLSLRRRGRRPVSCHWETSSWRAPRDRGVECRSVMSRGRSGVNRPVKRAPLSPTPKVGHHSIYRPLADGTVHSAATYQIFLWTHAQLYFADVFLYFFMRALVGQTAERIFTKLSHVVGIRCYLRTY